MDNFTNLSTVVNSAISTDMIQGRTVDTETSLGEVTTAPPEEWTLSGLGDDASYRRPLLDTDPLQATIYLAAVMVLMGSGVVGNTAIIASIAVSEKLRYAGYEVVINQAIADLLITTLIEPMCVIGITHGLAYFDEHPALCEAVASLCLTACFCAFFSLAVLTLNRAMYIFRQQYHTAIFSKAGATLFCLSTWVLASLLEMPNFLGWGGHHFDESNHQCAWNRKSSRSYTLFVVIGLVAIPIIGMLSVNLMIFTKVYRSKLSVNKSDTSGCKFNALNRSLKACRSLVVILVAFLICWTPYVVISVADPDHQLPVWVHLWATLLAHSHSSLNFFIYGATNAQYRKGYRRIFRVSCACSLNGVEERKKKKLSGKKTSCSSIQTTQDQKVSSDDMQSWVTALSKIPPMHGHM